MSTKLFDLKRKAILDSSSYADFHSKLAASGCPLCPQLCAERTTVVVDRGNPEAKLIFVGEAPGEKEDLQGQSFVGRSGQLLDKMMASIGLDMNRDALIVNVVKCRPPKNRAPKSEEAENCWPYLKWQIDFVKPRVVVLLGATAAKYFLAESDQRSMKESVGKFFNVADFQGVRFQVLYHPAYLLRDPRKKTDMLDHLKELKSLLETEELLPAGRPK